MAFVAGEFPRGGLRVNANEPTPVYPTSRVDRTKPFFDSFRESLKINIQHLDEERIVFDLVGVDASIANALRRIILSEVPTVAIENVYIWNNSSIIQDEVLSHRLGLIPIRVDPREFEMLGEGEDAEKVTDRNTVVFKLNVTCRPSSNKDEEPEHSKVFSSDLEWVPQGSQEERFKDTPIEPVHKDILIAKLKPHQSIQLEAHCRKGVGKDHAKFSPVCTASYRLLPVIKLKEEIKNEEAEQLKQICPMNVFDIEELGKREKRAVVARPRDCTMCRECIRDRGSSINGKIHTDSSNKSNTAAKSTEGGRPLYQKVDLLRQKDHFIFSVESVGMLPPETLVSMALEKLFEKCECILQFMEDVDEEEDDEDAEEEEDGGEGAMEE